VWKFVQFGIFDIDNNINAKSSAIVRHLENEEFTSDKTSNSSSFIIHTPFNIFVMKSLIKPFIAFDDCAVLSTTLKFSN